MPFWWEENITTELLDDESLLHIFPYMCKIEAEDRRSADMHDPITSTVVTFLTCHLQLGLTEVGATVFQGRAAMVYPYNLMSERQRAFVRDCIERREEWNLFNEAVVFRKTRGGGQLPLKLSPTSVLTSLCSKVFESSVHHDPKRRVALCNIILQRVQGYVAIDKPVQRQLNQWLAGRVENASSEMVGQPGDLPVAPDDMLATTSKPKLANEFNVPFPVVPKVITKAKHSSEAKPAAGTNPKHNSSQIGAKINLPKLINEPNGASGIKANHSSVKAKQ
jgi:hypothetical protein